ncbi:MAG TPA: hypothetical protein VL284_08310 [Thermoanaerobaculia bacterium]|nr:hypothetical protein [Thermoanaerobaculia bacterium]
MQPVTFGLLAGLIFGLLDVALMIPMKHPNKKTAMLGAFFSRFAIGFLIGVTRMPVAGWLRGVIVGVLISIPDAIVTKAYAPILTIGVIGGAVIGWLAPA